MTVMCVVVVTVAWCSGTTTEPKDSLVRRFAECALDRQRLLDVSHSSLKDKLTLKGTVTGILELEKEHVAKGQEHMQVLNEHLALLGTLDTLQREHLILQKEEEALQEDHQDCLGNMDSLGKDYAAVMEDLNSREEEYRSLKKDHELLLEDYRSLQQDNGRLRGIVRLSVDSVRGKLLDQEELTLALQNKVQENTNLKRVLAQASSERQEVVQGIKRLKEAWMKIDQARREEHQALSHDNQMLKWKLEQEQERHRKEMQNLHDMYVKSVREKEEKERD